MKKEDIEYIDGDIFGPIKSQPETTTVFLPHVCNNRGVFGSGFVVPLAKNFPSARTLYQNWHHGASTSDAKYAGGSAFKLGATQIIEVSAKPRILVFNMIAQELGGIRPLHYNMLARCMDQVAEHRELYPNATIHCPLFGAGLAGGNWDIIEELIDDCWLRNHNIPTNVYYLPNTLEPMLLAALRVKTSMNELARKKKAVE